MARFFETYVITVFFMLILLIQVQAQVTFVFISLTYIMTLMTNYCID